MKKLQILRVDNDLVEKVDLKIGKNIVGRNATTGCADGQIIKHAVTINVSPDSEMTITPVTSCYMKSTKSSRWQLLKLGSTIPIKPGDVCSLVPSKCWFKIVLVTDITKTLEEYASKRKAIQDMDYSIPEKKFCSQVGEGDNSQFDNDRAGDMLNNNEKFKDEDKGHNHTNRENVTVTNLEELNIRSSSMHEETHQSQNLVLSPTLSENACKVKDPNKVSIKDLKNEEIPKDSATGFQCKNANVDSVVTGNCQSPGSAQADESNTSDVVISVHRRDKCTYGEKCYRRNQQHKTEFSHPGDVDYNLQDEREECPYGTKCYRKDPQHKIQYKHTGANGKGQGAKRPRKQSPKQVTSDVLSDFEDFSGESAEESVDESEYEPSTDAETSDDEEAYSDKDESETEDDAID